MVRVTCGSALRSLAYRRCGTVIALSHGVRLHPDASISADDSRPRRNGCANGTRTVVVVGNGMVGQRFCECLASRDSAGRFRVVCFGEEPRVAYDRVHLSSLFAGTTPEALALSEADWYTAHGVALHVGERVTAINRARQTVASQDGRTIRYDVL